VWRSETHQGRYYRETSGLELALGLSCVWAYLHRILPEGVQENFRKLGLVTFRPKCDSWGVLSTSVSHYCLTFWVQVPAATLWHSSRTLWNCWYFKPIGSELISPSVTNFAMLPFTHNPAPRLAIELCYQEPWRRKEFEQNSKKWEETFVLLVVGQLRFVESRRFGTSSGVTIS
jgi:hypothetical protein